MVATQNNTTIEMNDEILLLQNGFIEVPYRSGEVTSDKTAVATVFSNMAYYGYVPSKELYDSLVSLPFDELVSVWSKVEYALKHITGADRNMGKFVVYQNFPTEVLKMSQAEYWIKQILMYWGFDPKLLTEAKEVRSPIFEKISPKVLHLANGATKRQIFSKLIKQSVSWTDTQKAQACFIMQSYDSDVVIDLNDFNHKTNGIQLIADIWTGVISGERKVHIENATDVLRLAAALSGNDVTLRTVGKFRKFSRPERRFFVNVLDKTKHLEDDIVMRKEQWKRFLSYIRPGEYNSERLQIAYNYLYNNNLKTFNSYVEDTILNKNFSVLTTLQSRPGDMLRRIHKLYEVFRKQAFVKLVDVFDKLTIHQLVKLDKYLENANSRKKYIVPPMGNWEKAQFIENEKVKIADADLEFIRNKISAEIASRLNELHPEGFAVSDRTSVVKLQSNGQELTPYGRGTVFDIPENIDFIRTASYWSFPDSTVWFDNGINFFNEDWKALETVCWNGDYCEDDKAPRYVFSGDPINSNEEKGRACQMIDIYPKALIEHGVRYAVWGILSFSSKKFSEAKEIVGTIQWGESSTAGELYEPSRAQLVFPITGKGYNKYVLYIDLVDRKLVYLDMSLPAHISSAVNNKQILEDQMPVVVEHLNSIPSIADLLSHTKNDTGIPVLFDDEAEAINGQAYVFKKMNVESNIDNLNVEAILER